MRAGSLELVGGKEAAFIAFVGTAGLSEGTGAYCHRGDFDKVKMVGEVEFPRAAPAAPLRVSCAYDGY